MSKYRVKVPFQGDMGSIAPFHASSSPMESKEANALWTINSMRDHDGLRRLKSLNELQGTVKFERVEE